MAYDEAMADEYYRKRWVYGYAHRQRSLDEPHVACTACGRCSTSRSELGPYRVGIVPGPTTARSPSAAATRRLDAGPSRSGELPGLPQEGLRPPGTASSNVEVPTGGWPARVVRQRPPARPRPTAPRDRPQAASANLGGCRRPATTTPLLQARRSTEVQAALRLGRTSGPAVLAGRHRQRAGLAPDGWVAAQGQRVHRRRARRCDVHLLLTSWRSVHPTSRAGPAPRSAPPAGASRGADPTSTPPCPARHGRAGDLDCGAQFSGSTRHSSSSWAASSAG